MERPYNEGKQPQPLSSRTCRVHNKLLQTEDSAIIAPTTSYSEEDIMNFHNDIDETLGKPNYYTTVMGDFKTQIGIRTNPMETATSQFGLELKQQNR